ncbi:MAG: SDR family NAD(P)-dependent oxidoreductase [Hyphomicrobiaceae bacterium]|nr:SDR family NAD(P)-dependent oxidoreductase [Hyphomicrobiaceae bacterium]
MKKDSFPSHAIAVVGLAGRFPGARDLDHFWRNIRDGVETIETLSDADLEAAGVSAASRRDPSWVRKATTLEGAFDFDAQFFGISPREAQFIDPQQRIFLECAYEALEHAGWADRTDGHSVGVYAGAGMGWYLLEHIVADPVAARSAGAYQIMLGNDKDFLCTRASYKLDLRGPSVSIQTACSTSLVAVVTACRALARGECDMALAGGVAIAFPERCGYRYEVGMILSPDGHCRPFDAEAAGIRPGAGAGVVVLKRLADAIADRDTIHAVIRGAAVNNDGAGKAGYTAPSIDGQVEVIATAQALAEVAPRSIAYVEAHGTGTPLGDPIEFAALSTVFRSGTDDVGFCRLGSLKANIGHLDTAAGIAGFIKTVLVLQHREFPPLVNFRAPNPQLELETSPFAIATGASPWPEGATPRRAGVSSFGIGGTNAHVVLEEAPRAPARAGAPAPHLLVLSARTQTALDQAKARLAAHLAGSPGIDLQDVAWTLQVGRRHFQHRAALVADGAETAAQVLGGAGRPGVFDGAHEGGERPVVFMFSGQGSQHVGMGAGLYAGEPVYREAVDACARLLEPHLGLDIRAVIDGAGADINETRLAQPALFVCEYALARLWMSWGVKPAAMIGHSIGEYVAAHLAGVLTLEDALALVAARGRIMQAMAPGAMAAVHAARATVEPLIRGLAEIAAVNAPALCAIAGPKASLAEALQRLRQAGVEAAELKTSHAFHSSMMEPALPEFRKLLEGIRLSEPAMAYVSNVTGTWIKPAEATSPDYWCRHLRGTVEFARGLATVAADPSVVLLEVGPAVALSAIARMGLPKARAASALSSLPRAGRDGADRASLLEAAGRLWVAGVAIDWPAMHAGAEPRRIPLPTYPFERQRLLIERPAPAGKAEPVPARAAKTVDDFFYAPAWSLDASSASGTTASPAGTWLVLCDREERGIADALARDLGAAGAEAIVVEWVSPLAPDSLPAPRNGAAPVAGAIVLPGRQAAEAGEALLGDLIRLCEALDRDRVSGQIRLVLATSSAASVLGETIADHRAALALGGVLVLPTEFPGLGMRQVDFDRAAAGDPSQIAQCLLREACADDAEAIVAYRAGHRFVRRYEKAKVPAVEVPQLPLRQRGVYLITGGTGGMGLAIARWLAATVSARLLLLARTPLPPRPEWDGWIASHGAADRASRIMLAVREIEASGGEVRLAAADAADPAGVHEAVGQARSAWGAFDGVVHAAGIAGNGRLSVLKRPEDIRAVLAPKVDGLELLIDILGADALDFVALMSSVNAVAGAPGTIDYTAANAVLDAFVDSARRPAGWKRVVAFDWGAWRDVGMAANLAVEPAQRAAWRAYVDAAIRTDDGIACFARVLGSARKRVVVTPFEPAARAEVAAAASGPRPDVPAPPADRVVPARSSSLPPVELSTETERALAAIWTELLGVERIAADDNFFELGGHSLMATRALVRIKERFGASLVLRDVFDAPTLAALAARIAHAVPPSAAAPAALDDDREELVF